MPIFNSSYQKLLQLGFAPMILIALVTGCTTSGKNLPVTEARATMADHVQEATMRVESFFFEPSRIEVTVNVPVRLTLKSGAFIIPHNFSIHAPEAGIEIDADVGHGKTVVVEFTPTKPGEYSFYCDKDSHAKKGMTGTIVVK
jgi:plastocyanin domain-containing protein